MNNTYELNEAMLKNLGDNEVKTVKVNNLITLCVDSGYDFNSVIENSKRTTPIIPPVHPLMDKTVQSHKGKKLISHTKVQSDETYNGISSDNKWLFKDFIRNNTLFSIVGEEGSYKSTLLLNLAYQNKKDLTTFVIDNSNNLITQKLKGYEYLIDTADNTKNFNHNSINIYNSDNYVNDMDGVILAIAQCEFEKPDEKMLLIIDDVRTALCSNPHSYNLSVEFLRYYGALITRFKNLSIGFIYHKINTPINYTMLYSFMDNIFQVESIIKRDIKKVYINVNSKIKNDGKPKGNDKEEWTYCYDYSVNEKFILTEIKPRSENADILQILRENVINSESGVKREVLINVLRDFKITNSTKQQSILNEFKTSFTDIKINRVKSADIYTYNHTN